MNANRIFFISMLFCKHLSSLSFVAIILGVWRIRYSPLTHQFKFTPTSKMLGEGKRQGLTLSLNRSLSDPSGNNGQQALTPLTPLLAPPQWCGCQSLSLPASPMSESATIQRALILKRSKITSSSELSRRIQSGSKHRNYIIIDCRPFMSYNVNHIKGAINVNCSDRFNRKRLQQGKSTLVDLASTKESKDILKKRCFKEVILYDEYTTDVEKAPANTAMYLVAQALIEDNKEPVFLRGKLDLHYCHFNYLTDTKKVQIID